ncbi:MFS transporter [Pseudochryseolinea flava]|uniref:MFS transporter n=1 Tax=Pseudochryseolinea flava TaxID=2059302 RepID=A0A364Y4V1_9BACT|nr:MFS transporter [Pseudochryseolinea flava]RAW01218.1 MFS transporter [Pseudochryseolinea flava]
MSSPSFNRPRLSVLQIINMSVGFFGIQFGFALQNGFASKILTTFGANVEHLSLFWLAAPLTGMIIQPIIGHYSDITWTRLGRRRPFFLTGAIIASTALIFMPNADILVHVLPPLYVGAGILMIMDASFNVAMEPFRALVADLLPSDQRTLGFAIQTCLIGLGAVIGSTLPYILTKVFGVTNVAATAGVVAPNIVTAFYIGSFIFIAAIVWTVITTKEYPGEHTTDQLAKEGIGQIFRDFVAMPKTMKQLGVVQFFSWFALFSMWVFTNSAVAGHIYKIAPENMVDSNPTYGDASDWVGVIFGVYNGVSALCALFLPAIAFRLGRKLTHAISLTIGGVSLISIYFITNPTLLVIPMIGVGVAWASILAMPYAILAGAIPPHKMGIYMGLFNFFITLPQIINGFVGGLIVKHMYNGQPILSIVMAGVFFIIAAACVRFVDDRDDTLTTA